MRAMRPSEAQHQSEEAISRLHSYAQLLGDERAAEEKQATRELFDSLAASPAASIKAVSDAHRMMRSTKDFNHK